MIKSPEYIKNLRTYKAGKPIGELMREKKLERVVKLASNENPLGPSPKALEAIKNNLSSLHRYSDPSCYNLINAIAAKYNKPADRFFAASGSDAILQYIVSTFSEEGDELLTCEHTFIGWFVNVNKYNRKSVTAPQKGYSYDLDAIAAAITDKTKIIYLANPNNPTGTMFGKDALQNFLNTIPKDILVIYDEAYSVYAEDFPDYPNGMDIEHDNVIVLRTFSKAFGLAGLRIGMAFAHSDIIRELYKVKLPFEPNALAQEAAIAALTDSEFIKITKELNKKTISALESAVDELGITRTETRANFFMMIFPDQRLAMEFHEECLNHGLILRPVASFGYPNAVRINSGTEEETAFAIEVLSKVHQKLMIEK